MYRQVNKPEAASTLLDKAAKMLEKDRPEDATGLPRLSAQRTDRMLLQSTWARLQGCMSGPRTLTLLLAASGGRWSGEVRRARRHLNTLDATEQNLTQLDTK